MWNIFPCYLPVYLCFLSTIIRELEFHLLDRVELVAEFAHLKSENRRLAEANFRLEAELSHITGTERIYIPV